MQFHVIAFSITAGLVWGAAILLVALANLIWPSYGNAFLALAASIYPAYQPGANVGYIILGTVYGFVDGAIGGAVFAWIYNVVSRRLSRDPVQHDDHPVIG